MDKVKRVALYARVSTEEQAEQGYSIEAQRAVIKEHCQRYNKVLVEEYVDAGVSGKEISKRLELQRLLKDAKENKFDEVLVWKFNRMSRRTIDLLEIIEQFEKYNVTFNSISEHFDTSGPIGKFMLQCIASIGELERNTIVENVKLGLKQRARQGWHSGGRALGYITVPTKDSSREGKNDLVIKEDEAVIIRKIFSMYCAGNGFRAIANYLNRNKYKTVRGNTFSMDAIREIIDNPLYKGYVRYCRYESWSEKRRKGKSLEPILVKGHHKAIISEAQWDKAAVIRNSRKKVTAKVYGSQNLLSTLLRCPQCGAPMIISRSITKLKDGNRKVYRKYSCSVAKHKGAMVCRHNSVPADAAEKYVINKIRDVLKNLKLVQTLVDLLRERISKDGMERKTRLQEIKDKLGDIVERRKKIMELYLDGTIDKDLLHKRLELIDSDNEALSEERSRLESFADLPGEMINPEYISQLLDQFEDIIQKASGEQKILLLRLMIDKITVSNHKIDTIYMRLGYDIKKDHIEGIEEVEPSTAKEAVGGLFLFMNQEKPMEVPLIIEIGRECK